ncbi:MAG: DUF4329 domain-containing protein [Pseudomonadota bacterium]
MPPLKLLFVMAPLAAALPAHAQDADLIEAARMTLASIQDNSFAADREYCGMIGENAEGKLVITRPRKGRRDSCVPRSFRSDDIYVLASYHTHGSYDFEADSEVPSIDDFDADDEEGVFGFVATPGGRFWVIDPERDLMRQICGIGCLPQDPDFEKGVAGNIPKQFNRAQLFRREQSN